MQTFIDRKALIFGGTGGIGTCVSELYKSLAAQVVSLGSQDLDLASSSPDLLLDEERPDIVICAAGVLLTDRLPYQTTFDVNFGAVWNVVRYYLARSIEKPVHIVVIGSTAFDRVSPNYILYAASKAAVISMVKSAAPSLNNKGVFLNALNPCRTNTDMRRRAVGIEPPDTLLDPRIVAEEVVALSQLQQGGVVKSLELP